MRLYAVLKGGLFLVYLPLLLVSLLLALSPAFQRQVLFLHNLRWPLPSSRLQDLDWVFGGERGGWDVMNVDVESTDGVTLHGYRVALPTEGKEDLSLKSTVIFFHGNGASRGLSWRVTHVLNLAKASSTVYAFDVRGYGDVDGSPTRDDVAEDARRIFDFVAEKEDGNIFLYGHSLGTGIVSVLGSDRADGVRGILLDSPFVNSTMAALHHPSTLLIRLAVPFALNIIKERLGDLYASDELLGTLSVDVLIMQGDADSEIPIDLAGGNLLVESVREKRALNGIEGDCDIIVVKGADHENVHAQEGFVEDVRKFIQARLH